MPIEDVVSTLTIVATFSLKLIGFPAQIKKVKDSGTTEGVSVTYFVLGFITYSLWTLHGVLVKDVTVIFGQGLGVVATGILLFVIYDTARRRKIKTLTND